MLLPENAAQQHYLCLSYDVIVSLSHEGLQISKYNTKLCAMTPLVALTFILIAICVDSVSGNGASRLNSSNSAAVTSSLEGEAPHKISLTDLSTINLTLRDDPPQAPPPPYVWQDFMYFEDGFPTEAHEYAVISAFIDTLRLASAGISAITSLQTSANPPPGAAPSFLRYFTPLDHPKVRSILTNILAVLGVASAERECSLLPRLPILYDDTWNPARHCLNQPDLRAYMVQSDNPGESFMNICPYFFQNYRRIDDIQCDTLGNTAENGFPEHRGMWSSGSVLLHELLHWSDLSHAQIGMSIVDQVVTRPSGRQTKAYGPYYSWLGNKNGLFDPLSNDDNYVYFAQEVFWSGKCTGRAVWADPPDLGQIFDSGRYEQ